MYSIVYADPPWSFKSKAGGSMKSGSGAKYKVMSISDIIDHKPPMADNCIVFMWWVASQPEEALLICKAWGLKVKTMTGFTWDKKTKTGKDHFGMGFYSRQSTENCLIAVKGRPEIISHSVRSIIHAPVGAHSEKPSEVRDRIVEMCGDKPRLEMYARQNVPGWDAFGNECQTIDL